MGDHITLPGNAARFESAFDELVAGAWDRLCSRVSVPGWEALADALREELRGMLARLARPTTSVARELPARGQPAAAVPGAA